MISSSNIGTINVVRKDYKKGKTDVVSKYYNIGMVDDDGGRCPNGSSRNFPVPMVSMS
jgi:hypothetical protein